MKPGRTSYPASARLCVIGSFLLLATAVLGQVNLPDIGDPSESALSTHAERALGESIMRELRATTPVIDDAQVSEYIQSLGYQLVSVSEAQYLGFNFFVVKDKGINAFALPGGYVGVNAGLILTAGNESELASVIAHEISHVTQRHIARFVEKNAHAGITALAGILAAIAVGIKNPEAGRATAAAVLGSQAQSRLNFTRGNEKEADRIGMQLLEKSKFDPSAMASFFEKLQGSSRYYRKPPEYLNTHPVTSSRIAEARDRALKLGYRQHSDSLDFRLVQARVRVLIGENKKEVLEYFKAKLASTSYARNAGIRYGLALAQARNNLYEAALAGMQKLVAEYPDNVPLSMSLAHIYTQAQNPQAALSIYQERYRLYPDNRLVIENFTRSLLLSDQSAKVLHMLDDYQRLLALNAPLLRIRAEALQAQGREAESQATLAEYFYRRGNLDSAIQQLVLASEHPGNSFYLASKIEARLEDLKKEHTLRNKP